MVLLPVHRRRRGEPERPDPRLPPPIGAPADRMRFAFASCQHYGQGYFTAYEAMKEDDLDLIVHLGDYISESDWVQKVRFPPPQPVGLDGYPAGRQRICRRSRSRGSRTAW